MERLTSRTLLLLLVALGVVLAGCAGSNNTPSNGTSTTPSADQLTPAGAKSLLESAASSVPDKFGMAATVFSGAKQMMTFNASFDNASKTSFIDIHADPAALGAQTGGNEMAASYLANGFSIYTSPTGSLYMANGTAFVFPPSNDSAHSTGMVPSPDKSPFGAFLNPEETISAFKGSNVTVSSVEPTTCHNQAAVRVVFTSTEQDKPQTATADVVNSNPPRLCHVETTLPKESNAATDPLSGANLRADLYYNNELNLQAPESVSRALGLRYASDKPAFGGSGGSSDQPSTVTWTFDAPGVVALADAQVEVKDVSSASSSEPSTSGFGSQPTLWSMTLAEGHKTQGGVTLAFTDKDGDGKVSRGDTLVITTDAGQEPATVVLKDLKTGTYVVPGPGLAVVLGLLGLAAILLRRRG